MMSGLPLWADLSFSVLPQQLVNGLLLGAIYALIALGYTMVYGVLRLINFAHGEVYMLGGYVALFISWQFGFTQDALMQNSTREGSLLLLGLMLIASMLICGFIGLLIEFLAYRPMRNQPRIAALITAIGVSLLLQYAGALFLPNSPPPSISEKVNPYRGEWRITLSQPSGESVAALAAAKATLDQRTREFDEQIKQERSKFDLSPAGVAIRDQKNQADQEFNRAQTIVNGQKSEIVLPRGQVVMFITSILLMLGLNLLVNFTKMGRAMRAASHDFDTASLMGINVNKVVTLTFFIGSALAGAGAMMNTTFLGTPMTTFSGVQPGVKAFVAAVLGGIGSIPGAVLGGLLMGMAETLVVWLGYGSYRDAVAFVILILVLLFRPGGIMGSAAVEKV
ncbi:MAG TPA: branched-chain amino acid ABC transporter permease [Fimbriimonadaceae bacterium]|nr:branched-chain amino acid ABC transporter permease [Fimbriimonadaceae bacterium]HRE94011.1 branched-chain amino acid ABC transporter permease [Fimbriimonadaceae bacterium]HRI73479.1 branched-chain amino acid ABC transporter permease [Fimbriimonadaceae bacterium]